MAGFDGDNVWVWDMDSIKQNLWETKTELEDAVNVLNTVFNQNFQLVLDDDEDNEEE